MKWRTGCRMLLIITLMAVKAISHIHEHGHTHVQNPFLKILKALGSDEMNYYTLQKLLEKLQFINCGSNLPKDLTDCHKCLSAADLTRIFQSTSFFPLSDTVFTNMAKFIVYFLTPEQNSGPVSRVVCTQKFAPLVPSSLKPENFSSSGKYVSESDLTKILRRIDDGRDFKNVTGCFSSHDIIHEAGVPHGDVYGTLILSEQQFDEACLLVILNLLQGKCIYSANPHHIHLPPREFFINYLYSGFGHDGHIPLDQLELLLNDLGVGQHEEHLHADVHVHKRSIAEDAVESVSRHRQARNVNDDDHEEDIDYNKTCYSPEQLLDIYSVNQQIGVTMSQFRDICPAIIQQLYTGVCEKVATDVGKFNYTDTQVWGYSFLAVTIISLLSIVGISVIPVMRKSLYKKVLALLVAFAVGTLAGDGIMHLLPHALKIHDHSGEETADDEWGWYWKLIVVIGGVYGFYLFETIMHFVIERKQKGHIEHTRSHNTDVGSTCRMMESHEMHSPTINQNMYQNLRVSCHKHHHHHHHNNHEVPPPSPADVDSEDDNDNRGDDSSYRSEQRDNQRSTTHNHHHDGDKHTGHSHQGEPRRKKHVGHSHQHDHGHNDHAGHSHKPSDRCSGHSHEPGCDNHSGHQHDNSHTGHNCNCSQCDVCGGSEWESRSSVVESYAALLEFKKSSLDCSFDFSNISSMAWTVIIGDTLHNISDGLAIGAAFADMKSDGPSVGISTALAVFCHELPHELGDFAVLLQAGMSVKMALLFNVLSACSCYIGLIIGLLIGEDDEVRTWVFAVTAGMFIYVALVDMLPELMHSDELHSDPLVTFLLQNVGIVSGFCLMILMARYEERIAIHL